LSTSRRSEPDSTSPFWEFDREVWGTLAQATPLPLMQRDIERLRGLGARINLDEVAQVYRPPPRLLNLYVPARRSQPHMTRQFFAPLHERGLEPQEAKHTPFVRGVAGAVAVGKSTTARVLRELLARWPDTPRVELITTDGFLYPNAELQRRRLTGRKGFPE